MTTRLRRHSLAAAVVLLGLLMTPADIFSCGPFFEEPVFTNKSYPDQPLELFAKGRLGIVLPGYERQFLVVAYRYLAGPPLSATDEQALISTWTPKVTPPGEPWPGDVPIDKWLQARRAALGLRGVAKIDIARFKSAGGYWQQYPNCGDDAFTTAAQTVGELAKQFGTDSEPVRDWVNAQDTVFKNCGDTAGFVVSPNGTRELAPHLPPPATMQNAVLRMDRDYQIAAANFYAGNWQTAAQQFQRIAESRNSPWRTWAPYLVARCYVRQATLGNSGVAAKQAGSDESSFNVQDMTAAEEQLQSILKNPALATIHPAAKRLLNYVEGRLHPDERLHEVAQQLEGHTTASDFKQDLVDFNWFIRRRADKEWSFAQWRNDLAQRGLLDDLTDWVITFSQPPDSLTHAVERWRATKSQAWLMAALSQVHASDPSTPALAEAAAAIAPSSPAYEMAVFHRARVLIERDENEAARQLLDANLKRFEGGPISSLNLLLAERFAVAADFHQFLEFAPRTPVDITDTTEGRIYTCNSGGCVWRGLQPGAAEPKPRPRFDTDSVGIINQRLPLGMLTRAATGDILPKDLRAVLGTAAWTRAVVLNDPQTAKALQSIAAAAHPELREYLNAYDSAPSKDARTFAATWIMLHFPGMKPFVGAGQLRQTKFAAIDNYRDNWWCSDVGARASNPEGMLSYFWDNTYSGEQKPTPPASPAFVSARERTAAEHQWDDLSSIGAAPNYFGRIVLVWAKAHSNDERIPEALHLLVRATRYGCTDDKTGAISKEAFDLLHARYPTSTWAKQTPYWFK